MKSRRYRSKHNREKRISTDSKEHCKRLMSSRVYFANDKSELIGRTVRATRMTLGPLTVRHLWCVIV